MVESFAVPSVWVIVTSIWQPSSAVEKLSDICNERGWRGVLVADQKTPTDWSLKGFDFLGVSEQRKLWDELSDKIPFNHYSRKNLGYLYAVKNGAEIIIDTDDDNIPNSDFGLQFSEKVNGQVFSNSGWLNIYRFFTSELIWPRGFSLEHLDLESVNLQAGVFGQPDCPIQQYLTDGDPDVDAIHRMLFKKPIEFRKKESPVVLASGSWCPFNSQSTVFFRTAFPLLYLPCFATFRMTDIWRSLIAQICLYANGKHIAFFPPGFLQQRNLHNVVEDMRDEIPGYLNNNRIVALLCKRIKKENRLIKNVEVSLEGLVEEKLLPEKELDIFRCWAKYLCD